MAGREFPLSFVVRAVDKATGPLRAITSKLNTLTAPFKKLGKTFDEFSKAAGFSQLAGAASGFGGAIKGVAGETFALGTKLLGMASIAGFALFAIIHGAVEAGDKLAEMSDRVGINVDAYASLQYAAGQADIEQEQFNASMDFFAKSLGEAKANGGSLLTFLQKVSPVLAGQVKHAKSAEEGISLMTDAFVKLEDPTKRAILAREAFGKSGAAFGTFLHQGSAAIQKQQVAYLRLHGSSEAFAHGASDLDNAMRDTQVAFLGLRDAAAGALFPAISLLTKGITTFFVANREGLAKWATEAGTAIQAWVDSGGIDRLVSGIRDLTSSIGGFIDFVGGVKPILIAVAAVMAGPLLAAIAAVIPAVITLGAALLTTPVGWFLLAVGAIAFAVYEIYKHWEPIKKFFADLWGNFTDSFKRAWEWVSPKLEKLGALLSNEIFHPFGMGGGLTTEDTGADPRRAFGRVNLPTVTRPAAAGRGASTNANVSVDFKNLPRGVTVTADKNNTQPVDLSLGPAMSSF